MSAVKKVYRCHYFIKPLFNQESPVDIKHLFYNFHVEENNNMLVIFFQQINVPDVTSCWGHFSHNGQTLVQGSAQERGSLKHVLGG